MISHTGALHEVIFPSLVWKMRSPHIFLTFDDGPHPQATPDVLSVLSKRNAKATFFLSGANIPPHRSLLEEIAAAGHQIGIHAYTHSRALAFSKEKTIEQILRTEEIISGIVPLKARLFRPPFGFFSWNTIRAARELGYKLIMWTVLTGDFRRWSNERVIRNTLRGVEAGAILVFHDNERTKMKAGALVAEAIDRIAEKGFTFQIIS